MGDDSSKSPLTRRVPGATRAGPASSSRPELPAELLQRMQAVVSAAHAQAKQEEETPGKQSAASRKRTFVTGGPKPSNGARPKLTGRLPGRLSDEDAEFDTDELPRLTASGAIASPALADKATAPTNHAARPDQAQRPGRGDHAAVKRDRRAERRERAAQAERERAERAQRERAAKEEAERESAREAELAARAAQVLRERERAAQEQAAKEAAARAERERAEEAERERVEREQAERERAAQAERERAAREQGEREQAERERAAREQAERDQAERERAAQAERDRAAQERAERDRAARERERAAYERAVQAEREHTAQKAERERQRAAQAERERAEEEREQARRERAERESAAPGRRAPSVPAGTDNTTQLIIAASTNGADAADAAIKRDGVAEEHGAVVPDDKARSDGAVKPNGTASPLHQRMAPARADVLEHPKRTARQRPGRRRGRTIALIAAAVVVVIAGPAAVILSRHTDAPADGSGSALRNEAAAWISQQISSGDVVSCDLAMCQTLESYGVSTGNLLVMNSADDKLLNSQVVVSTSAIRHLFGSRLDSVDAPVVIASFGSGKARIEVRIVAPHGAAAAYQSQLGSDLLQRKKFGTEEPAAYPRLVLSPAAHRDMITGEVDSRILLLFLLLLQPTGSVNVLGFGDSGPGANPDIPLRAVYLSETGAIGNVRGVLASLREQKSPYRPAREETVQFGGKRALYIQFSGPPVLGLITQ
jgi:hypothetical protein